MNDLIDTTEMYLRTIYELEEEGVVPLRARIAERLAQSGPTVSQTVARMERDGLLHVAGDRHLELTSLGRERAISVMRKHRLAERLLVDVIGLEWEQVHAEACRWEHVMSESVERKLLELLGNPTTSPYGNPIPGLRELTEMQADNTGAGRRTLTSVDQARLDEFAHHGGGIAKIIRIAEHVQVDTDLMTMLKAAGITPGAEITVVPILRFGLPIPVTVADITTPIEPLVAHAVIVKARP